MKNPILKLALVATLFCGSAFAQDDNAKVEALIRSLDAREKEAVLKQDFAEVDRLWASDFVVNNPQNRVGRGKSGPMRTAAVKHTLFNREIEFIEIHGDTAIVMGREEVISEGAVQNPGKLVRRRFTNIWMNRAGEWRLTARHASVICPTTEEATSPTPPK